MPKRILALFLLLLLTACRAGDAGEPRTFLDDVRRSHALAENWFVQQVRDKGIFRYIYHPKTGEYPDQNNAIRQLMAARLLAELSRERPELLPLHRRNLAFVMQHWYRERDDVGSVLYDDESKLGANALLLRTLLESPDAAQYGTQAAKLKNGILSLIQSDNSFHPFLVEPRDPYDKDYFLTFYSGEALLALAEYARAEEDKDVLARTIAVQDFYIDRYVAHLDEHYYPAYVPWHTQSLSLLWKMTGERKYADAIFVLNDKLLELQDTTKYIGRFFDPATPQYGTPHSSSDGVYTEGLAYAYEAATVLGDTARQQRYRRAMELSVRNLLSLQYTADTASRYEHPDRVIGAFKFDRDRSGIRIDSTQHVMDAYRKMLEVFE